MSRSSFIASGCIKHHSGWLNHAKEVRILDRGYVDEVDLAMKQRFQGMEQAKESIGRIMDGQVFKLHQKIQIASGWIEPFGHGRSKQLELPDPKLSAQRVQLGLMFGDDRRNAVHLSENTIWQNGREVIRKASGWAGVGGKARPANRPATASARRTIRRSSRRAGIRLARGGGLAVGRAIPCAAHAWQAQAAA